MVKFLTKKQEDKTSLHKAESCSEDEAMQTVFQKFGVEIYQQADPVPSQTKIGQNLRHMYRQNVCHRLYFDNIGTFHDEIGTVSSRQADTLVNQRDGHLPRKGQAILLKLLEKALLVHFFQQTRSQRTMNFCRQPNNLPGAIPGKTIITFFFVTTCLIFLIFVRHLANPIRTGIT
jgi:hypothetical protein